jgi:alpha-beta hydrolase superfamily lysophospholipase
MNAAKQRDPGLPIVLLGHSAGGVVSCLYARPSGSLPDWSASFMFQVPAPDFALAALKTQPHRAACARVAAEERGLLARSPGRRGDERGSPSPTKRRRRPSAMVRADERLKKEFPLITLPVLILHGTLDKATKPSGSQLFYDTAESSDKTLRLYDGYFHDMLNDVGKEAVMRDITAWIDARVGK